MQSTINIEAMFNDLLINEGEISVRKTEIDKLKQDFERKAKIISAIIGEHEEKADLLRSAILSEMEQDGLVETEISMFKVRRKKCVQSVVIEDESVIPGNYIITKTPKVTTAPDKVLIAKLLRAGHEIAGARLSDEKYELEIKGK